ncbi:hypothetical protein M409DRAFT_21339 [Zasmidium cellare ATCC 36951]|uniref:Uncharacterized protein n=1 Tax=Zasmidium cellare ATCC 36951 TaxID=1080233 RepID=A0A6A6CR18_ZASCE|nr:uncharacterized protein M409DRAFT_21339 [Zasmidium cellare ATCC 36951]KAF2168590.1 hypothetical protein M409DRAFT_21339 [Zasmidium cellare ATCC 36951]
MAASRLREATKDLPSDPKERKELYNAARDLMLKTESPRDTHHRLLISWTRPMIQIGIDLGIFRVLAYDPSRSWSIDELSSRTGAEATLLQRVMRALAAHGTLTQTSPSTYAATNITVTLAHENARKQSSCQIGFCGPFVHALPRQLARTGYRNPCDVNDSAFQLGYGTSLTPYLWLQENPETAKLFFDMMPIQRAGQVCWTQQRELVQPLLEKHFTLSTDDITKGRALLVDIGSGAGHQSIAIRENLPELKGRIVLQDMEFSTTPASKDPRILANDIEVLTHDFTLPQPSATRGAKVYYLRSVLHNWDNEACMPILTHVRDALAEDSVLVIDEMVVSEMNASAITANYDTIMMGFATQQRTKAEWETLLRRAGLRIRETLCYDEESCDCLMVVERRASLSGGEHRDSVVE